MNTYKGEIIEFRAFHNDKMTYQRGPLTDIKKFFQLIPDDSIITRFTGQIDMNNKKVYAGDILEFDREEWGDDMNIHIVSYDGDNTGWCFGGGTGKGDMHFRKVIGNVFQTPELIPEHLKKAYTPDSFLSLTDA